MADLEQGQQACLRIYTVLARRIRIGEYPAGARLPTRTELGPGPWQQARR